MQPVRRWKGVRYRFVVVALEAGRQLRWRRSSPFQVPPMTGPEHGLLTQQTEAKGARR
jgi:hypothetical protein